MVSFPLVLASVFVVNPIAALAFTPSAHAEPDPDQQFVTTESRKVRCIVQPDNVGCQSNSVDGFMNAPVEHGYRDNNVWVDAGGGPLRWNQSNMPSTDYAAPQNDLVLTYGQVFHLKGWTVEPNSTGTRFTNDVSGHGMFVSVAAVTAF
ncbi:hypothetical protein [Mycolicibacterium arenosum]|uniref:Uncharacterized protein n=1 Tax=Mycolicibacterium arenosum TaxID=2952157 RepID=A0ABT1M5F7_9MYCO|nr:hypothetical protein [Mycolicibacterium sp. CAU 1645]MCP9274356.1 hypothetical protein [Mycolicibacterium sp. CAU 1645]